MLAKEITTAYLVKMQVMTRMYTLPQADMCMMLAELLALEQADLKEMVFVVIQGNGETQVCRVDMTK